MAKILDEIAHQTKGKSYKTSKYEFDGIELPQFEYDDRQLHWKTYGETEKIDKPISMQETAKKIKNDTPLFRYFLDGSRHTYKVDDISYHNHVYPVIAGQVGVGSCERINKRMRPLYKNGKPMFERQLVISLPNKAKEDDWEEDEKFSNILCNEINKLDVLKKRHLQINKILPYSTKIGELERYENKGIAQIQAYMVECEKAMVADLNKIINPDSYLLKDGSLEYQVLELEGYEREKFIDNYRYVVGASKSFNPLLCVDRRGKNVSNQIAELPLYYRTPAMMYQSERIGDMYFAVWFVRIREKKYTENAFDGILKLEKILIKDEIDTGLETDQINFITANIINERNPVCYGSDKRWANHLYPIYVTERFVKSKYLSENMFLKLF